jgi:hypothetical protein
VLISSVKQAKAVFLKKVKTTYPNIKESDLEIKMSKAVEKMEQARRKAWQHPENLIPLEEIEGESFDNRRQQIPFGFSTTFDDGFGDDAFGFGMIFEQAQFPSPPKANEANNRSIAGAAWPGSGLAGIQRTTSPAAFASRNQIGTPQMGNTRTSTAQLGNTADSRSALAQDMANFLRISRPAAESMLSRKTGDPGVGPSTTSEAQQNAAASSSRAQTRAVADSDHQPNDIATSGSRSQVPPVASSSPTISVKASNLSRMAAGETAAPNNAQRSASTTPARPRATTAQTSSGVLNPSLRTGTGAIIIGQPPTTYMGSGTSMTRNSRTSRGNSMGRSNAQSRTSMTRPLMLENDFYSAGIYGPGRYPIPPFGYGHDSSFETYEDPYYDDFDDPYGHGYYGGRRYY